MVVHVRRGLSLLLPLLLSCSCWAYLLPCHPSTYFNARSKQLGTASKGTKANEAPSSVLGATKGALDYMHEVPELLDPRLAGWRVSKGGNTEEHDGKEVEVVDSSLPNVGDVVEYKLSERVKAQSQDGSYDLKETLNWWWCGREKGVGVLLSINKDRGDAVTLAPELLSLCEVQILTLDLESNSEGPQQWMKDDTEARVYVKYEDLKPVRSKDNGGQDRWKRWVLEEELSPRCGPPNYADEEMEIL